MLTAEARGKGTFNEWLVHYQLKQQGQGDQEKSSFPP